MNFPPALVTTGCAAPGCCSTARSAALGLPELVARAAFCFVPGSRCLLKAWEEARARSVIYTVIFGAMGLAMFGGMCVLLASIWTASTGPPFMF